MVAISSPSLGRRFKIRPRRISFTPGNKRPHSTPSPLPLPSHHFRFPPRFFPFMPKHKSPNTKAKGGLGGVPKSGHGNKTKRKSKPRRLSIENLIELPDDGSPRGPVLRVTLPSLDEMDDGPAEVPATEGELKRRYKPFAKIEGMFAPVVSHTYLV